MDANKSAERGGKSMVTPPEDAMSACGRQVTRDYQLGPRAAWWRWIVESVKVEGRRDTKWGSEQQTRDDPDKSTIPLPNLAQSASDISLQ
jgi:hypothetical protein